MSEKELTRRDFLLRITAMGAFTVGSGTLLSACGGGEAEQPAAAPPAEQAPAVAAAPDCSDLSGLTDAEKQMRTQLQYVAETPDPSKRCDNCALYVAPVGNSPCGGCQIIKGPIDPAGYCVSWSQMQS